MKNKVLLTLLAGLAVLSSCTWEEPLPVGSVTVDFVDSQRIYELDFTGKSALDVTINNVSGKNVFVVQSNAGRSPKSSSYEDVNARLLYQNYTSHLLPLGSLDSPEYRKTYEPVAKWEEERRNRPLESSGGTFDISRNVVSSEPVKWYTQDDVDNEKKEFWIDYEQSGVAGFAKVNGTLRAVGDTVCVWVLDGTSPDPSNEHPLVNKFSNFSESDTNYTNGKVSRSQINAIVDKMDGVSGPGIYDLVSDLIGHEIGGGINPDGTIDGNGGIDGVAQVNILVYDISGDLSDTGVIGYYWPKDQFTTDSQYFNERHSNEMEIFYMDSYFIDSTPEIAYTTLAHEYQHMVHYSQVGQYVYSEFWFNEMCSMLIEDVMQEYLGDSGYGPIQTRTFDYINFFMESGVTDWHDSDSWRSYASAYMFGAFLVRNYGGGELIKAMLSNQDLANEAAISEALKSLGYADETFTSVFEKYVTAHVFDNTTGIPDAYTINKPGDAYPSSYNYPLPAFSLFDYKNLWAYEVDTDGYLVIKNGRYVLKDPQVAYMDGPFWLPLRNNISIRPYGIYLSSYSDFLPAVMSQISLRLVAPDDGVKVQIMVRD